MTNEKVLKVLNGLIVAGIFLLLCDEFGITSTAVAGSLPFSLHLLITCLMLLYLALIHITTRLIKAKSSAHVRELMEMQQELNKTARRFKSLLEGAGNAIFVFNADTAQLEDVNRLGTELLGFDRDEIFSLRGPDLVLEADREKFSALVLRVKRRGRGRSPALAFRRKDGHLLIGEIDARLIDLGDEKVVHVTVRDVTYKHQAQREIRRRNHELTILNNILTRANESLKLPAVLDVTLRETRELLTADAGVIHLLAEDGQTLLLAAGQQIPPAQEAQLKRLSFSPGVRCSHREPHAACNGAGGDLPVTCPLASSRPAGDWQGWLAVPLLAHNRLIGVIHLFSRHAGHHGEGELAFLATLGKQIGIVIEHARLFAELSWKNDELQRSHALLERSSHELTLSQKRLKNNLHLVERANQELERLDRMKSQFLGMISHEFKTPLTSIIGSADLLINGPEGLVGEEGRKLVELIHGGGNRLNEIVNDLLKVARLEARSVTVNPSELQLGELLERLREQFAPLLAERRQVMVIEDVALLPCFAADREIMENVFSELLENAVKFTPDGGEITISAAVTDWRGLARRRKQLERFNRSFYGQMGPQQYLFVEVRDTGIGIDPAEHLHIFEKFYELGEISNHYTSNYKFQGKGAGLGLTIVKGMVEAHGGMVWVENHPEGTAVNGTSFFLLLPLGDGAAQQELPFAAPPAAGAEEGMDPP